MTRSRECVVMFCGPNYGKLDRSRIRVAILVAKMRQCPIIICGDANGNRDVNKYARIARLERFLHRLSGWTQYTWGCGECGPCPCQGFSAGGPSSGCDALVPPAAGLDCPASGDQAS